MARFSFPPELTVTSRFEPKLPTLMANSGQLTQVFVNLVVNAAQAMTNVPEARRRLEVSARSLADRLVVEITDQGVGIRAEDLPRVFDPFFSSKGLGGGGGIGLGLSTCHGIVQALGGELSLRSQLGVGTTATLVLPLKSPFRAESPAHVGVKSTPSQLTAP
jgi:signal transduction histidine kinase